jgi:glycosyltransferase involved in cell wall biosynthesis
LKTSVLIPAYNCSKTIRATLDSVLGQSAAPDEIIVLDDGSTDDTFSVVERYRPRVSVLRQANGGVAKARNVLWKRATGDLVAFLDSDDLWHPKYLEVQVRSFQEHPDAVAFFTGHVNFHGYDAYDWSTTTADTLSPAELIEPLEFLKSYNTHTGFFASMSYCCIPKRVFSLLEGDPFHEQLGGVEDSFFFTSLPLLGYPVVYTSTPMVAYRFTGHSLSDNRVRAFGRWVNVFHFLEDRYSRAKPELRAAFRAAYAAKRRAYAKILMGAGDAARARQQLRQSVANCLQPQSVAKSISLLLLTHMPRAAQPKWPSSSRQ